jgi:hypothetical protein
MKTKHSTRKRKYTMNKVIQDGIELFNVTVEIVNGVATVTPNSATETVVNDGPGEER